MKFATAAPEGVKRSSGSPVRFPTTVTCVSPAMTGLPSCSSRSMRALPVDLNPVRGWRPLFGSVLYLCNLASKG